jgi:hypothetical protein
MGTIKQLNGMLVVTHNAATQQQVEELLRQFRDQQGRVVRDQRPLAAAQAGAGSYAPGRG